MSDIFKMGLVGSKDEESQESVEHGSSTPELVDVSISDSVNTDKKKCISEASNITDINDIVVGESASLSESTFENEIDALSRVITEFKGETTRNLKCSDLIENLGNDELSENTVNKNMEMENRAGESSPIQVKEEDENLQSSVLTVNKEILDKNEDDDCTTIEENAHKTFISKFSFLFCYFSIR